MNAVIEPKEILIDARDITVSYAKGRGRQIILNDINIQVREGEFITVVGSSGCGKSTMLSLVLGSQSPTQGGETHT